jgi:LmbE family N-acetylglucosaminyl deacetylase
LVFAPHQDDEVLGCGGLIAVRFERRCMVHVTYRTAGELAAQLRELHTAPNRRRELRQRAQTHALCNHAIGVSFGKIARKLGLTA